MTPAQIALASEKQATSELSALTLGGQPPANPVDWINQRKAQIESDLTTANRPTTSPAAPPPRHSAAKPPRSSPRWRAAAQPRPRWGRRAIRRPDQGGPVRGKLANAPWWRRADLANPQERQ